MQRISVILSSHPPVGHAFRPLLFKALDTGIFVIHVYAGGVAAADGRLRLGDRILEVNGVNVERVEQKEFLKILSAGSKRDESLKITVKHNETLRKRLRESRRPQNLRDAS